MSSITGARVVRLSNGATSVLLSVLALAGSDLAKTSWEMALVHWLIEHDQSVFGLGMVGFDLTEIAWRRDDFDAQKHFVLRMIDVARSGHRWEVLGYRPSRVGEALRQLGELVEGFGIESIRAAEQWEFLSGPKETDVVSNDKCSEHRVYLHLTGCLLCNNRPIP